MPTQKKPIANFKGLNNVIDPLRLTSDWATTADNVDVTWLNSLARARGFVRKTTNTAISGAYATKDLSRLYIIDNGELRQKNTDLTYSVLKTGLTSAPFSFEEINGVVFYTNGTDFGCIEPSGWRHWGIDVPHTSLQLSWVSGSLPQGMYRVLFTLVDDRGQESGNSDVSFAEGQGQLDITDIPQVTGYTTNVYVTMHNGTIFYLLKKGAGTSVTYSSEANLGREFDHWGFDIPRGSLVAHFQGKLYCAESYPQNDFTAIWSSLPLRYHHFSYDSDGIIVPGIVKMLRACDKALIIGTDRQIFSYDGDEMKVEAEYGVVPGWHAVQYEDQLYFWTLRGLCSALPFKNLTKDVISVAPGTQAGAVVMEREGMRRYVVALHKGGQPYNRRTS